jgi:hypothetical protein
MSSSKEYAYTFRVILPGQTHDQVAQLSKEMNEYWIAENRSAVTSPSDDYLRLSIAESTEDPKAHLHFAFYLAKVGLSQLGVEPVFVQAHATSLESTTILNAHLSIIKEDIDLEGDSEIIDLTDDLFYEELNKS